jgi:hypothetical protein
VATLAQLETLFREHGIRYDNPGFYDDPAFLRAEQRDRSFLENYAEYVEKKAYSQDYLERSRRVTTEAIRFLSGRLAKENKVGACIDASGTLMRMLEREGIWSFMMAGATIVQFPEASRLRTHYFHPLVHPSNKAKTGHAWLRVPPFVVADVSLAIQGWNTERKRYVPPHVLSENSAPANVKAEDLFEPPLRELYMAQQGRTPSVQDLTAAQISTISKFPPFRIQQDQLRIRYIATKISAMNDTLENMKNLCIGNKYPAEIYLDFKAENRLAGFTQFDDTVQ